MGGVWLCIRPVRFPGSHPLPSLCIFSCHIPGPKTMVCECMCEAVCAHTCTCGGEIPIFLLEFSGTFYSRGGDSISASLTGQLVRCAGPQSQRLLHQNVHFNKVPVNWRCLEVWEAQGVSTATSPELLREDEVKLSWGFLLRETSSTFSFKRRRKGCFLREYAVKQALMLSCP